MKTGLQTILGAGGTIGFPLAKELGKYCDEIRLVSRKPNAVLPGTKKLAADLMDESAAENAVKDSDVAYFTAGLPFDTKTWKSRWTRMTQNVVNACIKQNCRLVYFDNTFMYGPELEVPITESHRCEPTSVKGKIRHEAAQIVTEAMKSGKLEAAIVRAAGFYGPGCEGKSMLYETLFKPVFNGKKPVIMNNDSHKHCATFVPDAAKSTAIAGNSDKAFGQVWHLPTAADAPTGKEWVELIAEQCGKNPGYKVMGPFLTGVIGLFVKPLRESAELQYLHTQDYILSSKKFEEEFGVKPTSYKEGIKKTVEYMEGS